MAVMFIEVRAGREKGSEKFRELKISKDRTLATDDWFLLYALF